MSQNPPSPEPMSPSILIEIAQSPNLLEPDSPEVLIQEANNGSRSPTYTEGHARSPHPDSNDSFALLGSGSEASSMDRLYILDFNTGNMRDVVSRERSYGFSDTNDSSSVDSVPLSEAVTLSETSNQSVPEFLNQQAEPTSNDPGQEPTSNNPGQEPTSNNPGQEPTSNTTDPEPTLNNPGLVPTSNATATDPTSNATATDPTSIATAPEPTRNRSYTEEPPAKLRKISSPPKTEELDGETCPICLDSWGNSGSHRLVALKCGHLFGSACVERWLKAQSSKERSCPTCKSKAVLKDLRPIYARRLVAADTSQINALQKQVETIQAEKSRTELELQKTKIAHRACVLQLEVLRSTLMKSQVSKEQPLRKSWRFALEKNVEVFKDGGCRVMTYNCRTYELYISQKSVNYLFPGYGIRKVSCVDYKLGQFVHLHPKPIRDITYSQPRDLLLSVGLDSTARIMDRGIPNLSVNAGFPLWSCSWDYLRSNEFYVGGVSGMIHQYDCRNLSTYLATLQGPGDMSPVASICSTEFGLLSCQLNTCWLWVANNRQWEPRAFPVDGSFNCMTYDNDSHRALISIRPSMNNSERSKLTLCKLKASVPSGEILMDIEETFSGSSRSSVMTKAAWVKAPGASWVAAHSESDSALFLHGLDGVRTMSLPAAEPALDICSAQVNGSSILAALSDSRLRLYKAVATNG
ncbi:E3 ubiquitin-protein ligase rfwd3.L-like [Anticarsia gemmatalis]|uniref:E3 ubiquitin-protein ligase rfwd3.L-like n=1 Tax=Anticarsia gemmatalis TaxID=129554 RepID=UPI003F773A77